MGCTGRVCTSALATSATELKRLQAKTATDAGFTGLYLIQQLSVRCH